MFDITDPFGARRIKNLERELRRQKAYDKGEIEHYREKALEQGTVSRHLVTIMERDYKALHETKAEKERLSQMLRVCETARKNLAEENKKLNERFKELTEKYDELSDQLEEKKRELEGLYAEHEALIKDLRDSTSTSLEEAVVFDDLFRREEGGIPGDKTLLGNPVYRSGTSRYIRKAKRKNPNRPLPQRLRQEASFLLRGGRP